jgi:arginine decarboxylase
VFNVLGAARLDLFSVPDRAKADDGKLPQPVADLFDAYATVSERRLVECWHDAQQAREQAQQMFSLGYLNIEMRSLAERLYWATCAKVRDLTRKLGRFPRSLRCRGALRHLLLHMSVFSRSRTAGTTSCS